MLLKYYLPFAAIHPFIEGGYVPRVIHGSVVSDAVSFFPTPSPFERLTTSTSWPVSHGLWPEAESNLESAACVYRPRSATLTGTTLPSWNLTATVHRGNRTRVKWTWCSGSPGRSVSRYSSLSAEMPLPFRREAIIYVWIGNTTESRSFPRAS